MDILLAGLVALASTTAPAVAAPEASNCQNGARCGVQFTAEQLFYVAEQLNERGAADQAVEILKTLSKDPRADYRAEARVRIARILEARGDRAGAARWFEQLLQEKPDAAAVRIELAALLTQMGQPKAAVRELRRAAAAGLPENAARAVRNAASVLRENAPLSASFSIGIAPDTNINSATTARTVDIFGLPFEISKNGRANSGIGVTFNGQVVSRAALDQTVRIVSEASVAGSVYRDGSFNDVTVSADSGPELSVGHSRVRPSAVVGTRIFGPSRIYDFYGLNVSSLSPLGAKGQGEVTLSVVDFAYKAPRQDQSGPSYSLGLAYDRVITPRLSLRAGVNVSRIIARDPQFSSIGYSLDLLCSRDFGGVTAFARGVFTALDGDSDFAFFDRPRRDRLYAIDGGVTLQHFQLAGLSPSVRLTYTHSNSEIDLYRYRRLRLEISLEKIF